MDRNIYQRMALFLSQKNDLPKEKYDVLVYGLEILFINLLNLILTMLIGFLLGVLLGTVTCILVATSYRHTAGGAHSSSPWICAIATMIIFPILAYLGTYLANSSWFFTWSIIAAATLIGFYTVHRYAPVDSIQAPIISFERRKRLKRYSYMVIGIMVTIMLFLELISGLWLDAPVVQTCVALAVLWVSFNLTDTAASLWRMLDNQHNFKNRR